jgi:hypothetical protein
MQSPLPQGAWQAPGTGLYEVLRNVLYSAGVKPSAVEGIIMGYSHTPMDNVDDLARMMRTAGCTPVQVNFATELWRREVTDIEDESASTEAVASPLDRLKQKHLGAAPRPVGTGPGTTNDTELAELNRRDEELDKRRIRLVIQRKEQDLAVQEAELTRQGGQPAPGQPHPAADEDEIVSLNLEIGGVPVTKRVRISEISKWERYIPEPRTRGAAADESPTVQRLQAELAEMRERDRRREEDEKWNRRFEQLEARVAGGGGTSDRDDIRKEMQEMREQRLKDEKDRLADQVEAGNKAISRLEERVERMGSVDYALQREDVARREALRLGMVPKGEAARLTQEQIELEAERDAAKTRSNAQAESAKILAEEVRGRPKLAKEISEAGLPKLAVDVIRKVTSTPEEQAHESVEASPQEMERLMKEAEAGGAPPAPPPQPPPAPPRRSAPPKPSGLEGVVTR